jgi:hypothetical protein
MAGGNEPVELDEDRALDAALEPCQHLTTHSSAGFGRQIYFEFGSLGLAVAAIGQERSFEFEPQHAFDIRVGQAVDTVGVVEKVGVFGAVFFDLAFEMLRTGAEEGRRIERHVGSSDRPQRQAVKRDFDEGIHACTQPIPEFALFPIPGHGEPSVFGGKLVGGERPHFGKVTRRLDLLDLDGLGEATTLVGTLG